MDWASAAGALPQREIVGKCTFTLLVLTSVAGVGLGDKKSLIPKEIELRVRKRGESILSESYQSVQSKC